MTECKRPYMSRSVRIDLLTHANFVPIPAIEDLLDRIAADPGTGSSLLLPLTHSKLRGYRLVSTRQLSVREIWCLDTTGFTATDLVLVVDPDAAGGPEVCGAACSPPEAIRRARELRHPSLPLPNGRPPAVPPFVHTPRGFAQEGSASREERAALSALDDYLWRQVPPHRRSHARHPAPMLPMGDAGRQPLDDPRAGAFGLTVASETTGRRFSLITAETDLGMVKLSWGRAGDPALPEAARDTLESLRVFLDPAEGTGSPEEAS